MEIELDSFNLVNKEFMFGSQSIEYSDCKFLFYKLFSMLFLTAICIREFLFAICTALQRLMS